MNTNHKTANPSTKPGLVGGTYVVKFVLNEAAEKFARDCNIYSEIAERVLRPPATAQEIETFPNAFQLVVGLDYIAIIGCHLCDGGIYWHGLYIDIPKGGRPAGEMNALTVMLVQQYGLFLQRINATLVQMERAGAADSMSKARNN